jgi:glycosyltransferase involved in cell wall biosynthesis
MKKICIVSDLHLSTNPRAWKEANTLAAAGYDVTILTMWTSAEKRERDKAFLHHPALKYKAGLNLIPGEVAPLRRFYYRLRGRLEREAHRLFRTNSPWTLGYGPDRMTKAAVEEKADLYIAHTEYGIVIGNNLLAKGCNVAFDIEDWYSEDYLVPTRPLTLLKAAERSALTDGVYCTCPSRSMSEALQERYPGSRKAEFIYNGFSRSETPAVTGSPLQSLIWFSQTIGPGRGLETALEALRLVQTPMELHLVGDCIEGYDEALQAVFPKENGHRLIIHPAVPHAQLAGIIAKHRIGLAVEHNYPGNKDTTVSNKILQYLQAGIQVLATATKGQQEVAAHFPDGARVVPPDDPRAWAAGIESLLRSDFDRERARRVFEQQFAWEAQEKKLLPLVANALK